jgi:hypothetical protein
MTRRHNPLRIKQDATYTAREIAEAFKVTVNTVGKWKAAGLHPIDRHVPFLYHGRDIQAFVRRRNKPYEPLGPGEFFCICCKGKRLPAHGQVWLTPRSERTADYTADCCGCGRRLYRRVRLSEVHRHLGAAELIHEDGKAHVGKGSDSPRSSLQGELAL